MTHKQWENGEYLNIHNATKEQLKLMIKARDEEIKSLRMQLDEGDISKLEEEENIMSYYNSPKQYENKTGKRFTTDCPSIHRTGSVRGMVKLGFTHVIMKELENVCQLILLKNFCLLIGI